MDSSGLDSIASALGITPEVIAWRRAALGLDEEARARLRGASPDAAGVVHGLIERLYEHLRAFPAMQALLTSDELVARLKAQQRRYLHELFTAELDWPYVLRRLAIGEVHHLVRLGPQWYLATYAHIIAEHIEVLVVGAPSRDDGCERVCALIASVCLDAGLVLDSYGRSQEAALWGRAGVEVAPAPAPRDVAPAAPSPAPTSSGPTRIRLTADATRERRRFLGLSDEDLRRLRTLRSLVAASTPAILDDFYAMLASHPATAALVPPHTARQLKQQVASYWMELVDGGFDRPYAASRMRIGVIHEKVGVETASYLAGLARQLCGLVRAIVRERPEPLDDLRALVRAVFFDLSFVIDAYMEARVDTLLRTEAYASQLVAGLASAVAVIDARGRLISANRTLLTLIGGDPGTLYLLPLDSALPLPEAAALVRKLRASGQAREVGVGRLGDRTLRCTAMRLAGQGVEDAIALVLDDVSEILRLGHDFSQQANQFEQLADAAGAVLWEMDAASCTITTINRAALDLTGFRDVFFLGRPGAWIERIPERERERFAQRAAALPACAQTELEYPLHKADGAEIWVRTQLRRSRDGEEARLCGVTIDITARRRAEALRLAAVGTIAGGVAHVVNNALTGVIGNLDLQALELGGLSQAPLLRDALAAANRASEMAAQLLTFAGQQRLRPVPLSLSEVCRAAAPSLRTMLGPAPRLRMELDDALWTCRVDRDLLQTVLECLAANAREALGGAGEFVVATRNRPAAELAADDEGSGLDWVELEVSDTGCGMSEAVRIRALDPFFTTRSLAEATGLGLSMVYGFVTQSGGHLTLDSRPGEGTRVRLRFLRLGEPALVETRPSQPILLIVEDEPQIRRLAVKMARRLGYDVRDTGSPDEAVLLATALRPTILLTDVVLGQGTDGVALARRLANAVPPLAVVLTSGYGQEHFDLTPLPPGAQFLPKPFTLATLAAALLGALRDREGRLRQVNELFNAAVQSSPVVVFMQDRDLRYTWIANPALGYLPEEVVGRTDSDLCELREDAERLMALKRRVLETGEAAREVLPVQHRGAVHWYDLNVQPRREDGGVIGIIATAADVTDRKVAEDQARQADRHKSDFLAVLSHELRNPLAPIRHALSILERVDQASDVARRSRNILIRQVEQLTRLIDDLLDMTRVAHGKIELRCARLDVHEVIGKVCEDALPGFERAGVSLRCLPGAEPIHVDADRARLNQIVSNLLTNALKFTPPGGTVEVGVESSGGSCEIAVRDSGVGIVAGDLKRIFDPFVQADPSRRHGGLGIGLALVKDLVALHGGTVRASSDGPGQGARFVVTLPLARG